jgi:hypothetical protein
MKLSELNNASEELLFALKYSRKTKAKDVYNVGKLTKRTFYEVKELQRLLYDDNGFSAAITFLLELSHQKDPDLFEFFSFFNYCKEEIMTITEREEKALGYTPSSDEVRAGIDRFNKYGYLLSIDSLARGDVFKWKEARDLEYEVAFSKLMIDKDHNDFDRELFRVQNPPVPRRR